MEQVNQIINAIMPYVVTIVTALFGYLAVRVKTKLDEKLNTQAKKEVAEATVNYVQQVYESLDGKDKLKKALETSITWLNQKGIKVTEAEMTILIEAAIKGAKEGWLSTEAKQIEVNNIKALNEVQEATIENIEETVEENNIEVTE